jgi:hypothetical protein
MIKITVLTTIALTGLMAAQGTIAQEEKESPDQYIYATYFYCDTSKQEAVDAEVMKYMVPVYDAAVADGTIGNWGWLAHHTGGKWRRLQYHTANSIDGLMAAQNTIGERMDKVDLGDDVFSKACNAHDDYIWKRVVGNELQVERGSAGLSVYEICEINRETRADEIVEKVFAPVFNKAVADGKLASWGWNEHILGGKFRRLMTMTGKDFPSLLKTRGEILDELYGEDGDNPEANEYADICGSHADYLWEIQHEKN